MFAGPGFRADLLRQPEDEAALVTLFEHCADFFLLIDGEPPAPAAAHDLFSDLPPGKSPADKSVIGLWNDAGSLIGVIDMVRGYPEPGEWFVGLLLLHPAERGRGLGESIYRAFEAWATSEGAASIGLAVVEGNTRACQFWTRLGFQETRRTPPRRFGQREWPVIYMRRSRPSPT